MHRLGLAGWACLYAGLASTASGDTLSEAEYFAEQPVVLSASRLSPPVNRAPAAVTVITREMIEASGFRHLVDVLSLVPGFVVGWSGGNMPAASYQGLANAYAHWMQVMVDGRSVYNPGFGNTSWRGIPVTLDDVSRIEVVRGSNAANDGLNSLVGTIHIFTRHSAITLGGMGEVATGNRQFGEVNLRYGAETRHGSWRLGLLGREDQRHGVALDEASDRQLSFRGDFNPTPRDSLMVQLGASRGDWQGTNVGLLVSANQHNDYQSRFANLQWTRALAAGREWSLQLHHTVHQNEEAIPLLAPLDLLDGNYRTHGSGVQFAYLDKSAAELRTSLSGEYRLNEVRMTALHGGDAGVKDEIFRVSGAVEWSPEPEWVLHAAVMAERHSNPDDTYFSPRLALNWLPSSQHAFRLGVSHGVSAVGLYASDSDIKFTSGGVLVNQIFLGTKNLDPERVRSTELGYLYSKPEWGLNLDLRVFQNRFSDVLGSKIIAVPGDVVDGMALTFINNTAVTQRGLEYQLKSRMGRNGWLALSQSWVSIDSNQGPDYPRSAPRHILSLLAAHPVAGLDASLGYSRTSTLRWLGAHADSTYNRLDLRLAKDWKTTDGTLTAALVIQGLLGKDTESFRFYDRQPFERHGYLSLKYTF